MGLLDLNWDALNSDQGRMALGLLAAAGPQERPMSFGQRLAGAMDQFRNTKAAEDERKQRAQQQAMQMQQLQMDQLKRQASRQQAMEDLPGRFVQPGMKPDTMDNRDVGQPGEAPIPATQFDMNGYVNELFRYDPHTAMQLRASMQKDTTPMKVGRDDRLIDPITRRVVLDALPKEETTPADWKLYQLSGAQQRGIGFDQWDQARKRAGATNVSVNTEKPFLTSVASKLGDQLDTGLSQARAASQAVGTAQAIKSAIDSGKVVAGPGASFRVAGLQVGQMLGIGGKDAAEVLSNTRTVIQSMAKAELDAAQQMKGQGQITEAERDIIRRAASGNIDSLTTGEVRQLADAMEKTARFKIAAHRSNVGALSKMKEAAPLLPFYQVDEPAPYEPAPTAPGRVRRYNPQTGAIE